MKFWIIVNYSRATFLSFECQKSCYSLGVAIKEIEKVKEHHTCSANVIRVIEQSDWTNLQPEICARHVMQNNDCSSTFFYEPNVGDCRCVKKDAHCELMYSLISTNRYRLANGNIFWSWVDMIISYHAEYLKNNLIEQFIIEL